MFNHLRLLLKSGIVLLFFFSSLFTIASTVFFPKIRLMPFVGYLAFAYYRLPFSSALWASFFSGLFLDLISSSSHFGLHALIFCLTTLCVYSQKKHFFEDKSFAFCLFTALISCTYTIWQLILLYLFGQPVPFTSPMLFTDLVLTPFLDAIFVLFCFIFPIRAYHFLKKAKQFLFSSEE